MDPVGAYAPPAGAAPKQKKEKKAKKKRKEEDTEFNEDFWKGVGDDFFAGAPPAGGEQPLTGGATGSGDPPLPPPWSGGFGQFPEQSVGAFSSSCRRDIVLCSTPRKNKRAGPSARNVLLL